MDAPLALSSLLPLLIPHIGILSSAFVFKTSLPVGFPPSRYRQALDTTHPHRMGASYYSCTFFLLFLSSAVSTALYCSTISSRILSLALSLSLLGLLVATVLCVGRSHLTHLSQCILHHRALDITHPRRMARHIHMYSSCSLYLSLFL